MSFDQTLAEVFWANIKRGNAAECWPWKAGGNGNGYGRFALLGTLQYAHRQAFIEAGGKIPHGMIVRHKCDNPVCCNPSHLEIGTMADNSQDAVRRGRFANRRTPRGEGHGMATITADEVRELRSEFSISRRGDVQKAAEKIGLSHSQTRRILEGSSWKSL